MNGQDLLSWMLIKEKTVVDVASVCKISVGTVYNFLHGKPVHRAILAAIKRCVAEDPVKDDPEPPEAA